MIEKKDKKENKLFSGVITRKGEEYHLVNNNILDNYRKSSTKSLIEKTFNPQTKDVTNETAYNYNYLLYPRFDVVDICMLLDKNTYHRKCCEAVSEDASGYDYKLVPDEDIDISNDPMYNMIDEFLSNTSVSINQTFKEVLYDERSCGFGLIELVRESTSNSPPCDLNHLVTYNVALHQDGIRLLKQEGDEKHWFVLYGTNYTPDGVWFDVDMNTGEFYPYNSLPPEQRANEVFMTKEYNPLSPYFGAPPITSAIPAISGDWGRSSYNNSFFDNYGVPAYAIVVTGNFTPDLNPQGLTPDMIGYNPDKTIEAILQKQLSQIVDNPHSGMVLSLPTQEGQNANIELIPLNNNSQDASFVQYRKDNRDEVLSAHGVPPYRIGISETGSLGGNTSESSSKIYSTSIIQPLKTKMEDIINKIIRTEYDVDYLTFEIEEIDKREYAEDLKNSQLLFQMGAITPNELTEQFGKYFNIKPDYDNMALDEHYIANNPVNEAMAGDPGSVSLDNLGDELKNIAVNNNNVDSTSNNNGSDEDIQNKDDPNTDTLNTNQEITTSSTKRVAKAISDKIKSRKFF